MYQRRFSSSLSTHLVLHSSVKHLTMSWFPVYHLISGHICKRNEGMSWHFLLLHFTSCCLSPHRPSPGDSSKSLPPLSSLFVFLRSSFKVFLSFSTFSNPHSPAAASRSVPLTLAANKTLASLHTLTVTFPLIIFTKDLFLFIFINQAVSADLQDSSLMKLRTNTQNINYVWKTCYLYWTHFGYFGYYFRL